MKKATKKDFPVSNVRRFIEPGPIVLVSSHYQGQNNIMTLDPNCYLIMEHIRDYFLFRSSHRLRK